MTAAGYSEMMVNIRLSKQWNMPKKKKRNLRKFFFRNLFYDVFFTA
jgi:hypothetical protein